MKSRKQDVARLKKAIVRIIQEEGYRRLTRDRATLCGFILLPGARIAFAQEATPEQWKAAHRIVMKETLDDAVEALETAILFLVTRSCYATRGAQPPRTHGEASA